MKFLTFAFVINFIPLIDVVIVMLVDIYSVYNYFPFVDTLLSYQHTPFYFSSSAVLSLVM